MDNKLIRDIDIRQSLFNSELKKYNNDNNSKVVEELGLLWGEAIIDIAVINGNLHGYEIKSEVDTLYRFQRQFNVYNEIFDYLDIVISEKHYKELKLKYRKNIKNWGVLVVSGNRDNVKIKREKEPIYNSKKDILSICYLLWKQEAIDILNEFGITKSLKNKSRRQLYQILCETIDESVLQDFIRQTLKEREDWKVD